MLYRICKNCGAHLDPQEKCICREKGEVLRTKYERLTKQEAGGQMKLLLPVGEGY